MKKSLVVTLALVFVLGLAGTAFAANPFTDVPANHWAYAAVTKLAEDGIVDGYGDGRYIGNNTMSRYEMAQIVAKAMAKSDRADTAQRAQIERLAAEFADELDSLGVRVARLEKNADNVKITGEARFAHYNYRKHTEKDVSELRSRIWLTGQVNDRWSYTGMFENTQDFKTNTREASVNLRRAWVEGSIGVINVQAGRFDYTPIFGTVFDTDADGIVLNYSQNKWDFDIFALRPDFGNVWFAKTIFDDSIDRDVLTGQGNSQVLGAKIGYEFSDKFNAAVAYYHVDGRGEGNTYYWKNVYPPQDADIWEIGLEYAFDDMFSIWGNYLRGDKLNGTYAPDSDNSISKNGWAAGINYSNIDRNKPGSFEIFGAYYDVPALASIASGPELDLTGYGDGYKGWNVGATYMVAKNIDLNVEYYDFKTKGQYDREKTKEKLLWSYVRFYF